MPCKSDDVPFALSDANKETSPNSSVFCLLANPQHHPRNQAIPNSVRRFGVLDLHNLNEFLLRDLAEFNIDCVARQQILDLFTVCLANLGSIETVLDEVATHKALSRFGANRLR